MRNMRFHQLFIFGLSLILLLTMGMNFRASLNNEHSPDSNTKPVNTVSTSAPAVSVQPSAAVHTAKPQAVTLMAASKPQSVKASASQATAKVKPAVKPIDQYEVTAYYLNVRANGYSTSQIRKTVKKGDILRVVRTTDKGWLQLEGGGYVHGGYAKLIGAGTVAAKDVTVAAAAKASSGADALKIKPAVLSKATKAASNVKSLVVSEPKKPKSTVKSKSGLTEEHIVQMLENTALADLGLEKDILFIEEEYGVNAYFTIAVMKLESGNGKSKIARSKNNLFGLNAIDGDRYNKALRFETKGASIRKFGQLIAKSYLGKGYTTIEKIARKYCPANPKWPSLVSSIMKADYRKL